MPTNGQPRILVLRGGAIGDFVVTLPVLQALREHYPAAYLEVVGYPHVAELARRGGLADQVTSFHRAEIARLFAPDADLPAQQAGYLRSFDWILSYLYDPAGTIEQNLRRTGVRRYVCEAPQVTDRHAVDHMLQLLDRIGVPRPRPAYPSLSLDAEAVDRGRSRLGSDPSRVVVVHPGSGSERKNWPLGQFIALADRLRGEADRIPLFLCGEAEAELRRRLNRSRPDLKVLDECSLLEAAEVLAAAAGYVGNDSGITHLAAALGAPTVAVFGPTDPALWGPRGRRTVVVTPASTGAGGLAEIPVQAVWEALQAVRALPASTGAG